jgi:hypothetical protein
MDVTVLKKVGLEVGETPDLKQWKEFLNKKNAANRKPLKSVLWEKCRITGCL